MVYSVQVDAKVKNQLKVGTVNTQQWRSGIRSNSHERHNKLLNHIHNHKLSKCIDNGRYS